MGLKVIAVLLLFILVFSPVLSYDFKKYFDDISLIEDDLNVINSLIEDFNASWVAGETSISRLAIKPRLSVDRPLFDADIPLLRSFSRSLPLPSVNWSNVNGSDWVTPVKNQGSCGSCWIFSSVGAVESRVNIATRNPGLDLDLSEQDITSCYGDGFGCNGGWEINAFDYMQSSGIVNESCFPYAAVNATNYCLNKCYNGNRIKVLGYNRIPASVSAVKQAINDYGPVTVYMFVYSDFYFYLGGVYSHVWGSGEGFHSILITGYDDVGSYWICKNSWGTGWGEDGYFRVSYDENILDFSSWAGAYPSDTRSFFLDESYVVTSTDIDSDGVSDEVETTLGTNPLASDSDSDGVNDYDDECPLMSGILFYGGCPDVYAPEVNFSSSFFITGLTNLSWQANDYCDINNHVSLNYTTTKGSFMIANNLNESGYYLWDTNEINSDDVNITLFAYDDYGNNRYSSYIGVTIDNIRPEVSVISPLDGFISDGSPFDFNFSLSDNLNTYFSCLIYDNNEVIASFTTEKVNETVYGYSYTPVIGGFHSLNASCNDAVGLVNLNGINGVSFVVDLYGPSIIVNNPLSIPYNHYPGIINFSVSDFNLDAVNLSVNYINKSDFKVYDTNEIILSRVGDYFINDSFIIPNSTLMNFTFWANDSFGRVSEPFEYFLFVDDMAPLISPLLPASNSNVTVSNVTFSFNVSDDWPVLDCNLSVNNDYDELGAVFVNGSAVSFNKSLSDGFYDWFVNCSDYFNRSVSLVNQFKVDTLGPMIVINSPIDGVYGSNVIDVNVSIVDSLSSIDSVKAFVNDVEVVLSNIGDYWFIDDYFFDNNSPIALQVFANDSNGLNSSASSSFYVDNASPVINLFLPLNNSFVSNHQSDFNFTVSDNHALVLNCSIVVNNILTDFTEVANGSSSAFTLEGFNDGLTSWFINCSDGFNVGVSEVRQLTFDAVKPSLFVLSPVNITYNSSLLLINLSAVDSSVANSSYSFDGDVFSGYTGEFNRSFSEGVHYVNFSAVDKAGNFNSVKSFFSVDTSAPVVSISDSMNRTFDSPSALLSFTYSDYSPVYCAYSVDNSAFQVFTCVNLSIGSYEDNSVHSVRVMVNDSVGHSSVSNEVFFSINFNQAPVITGTYPGVNIEEGMLLYIDFNATDGDGDVIAFSDNTELFEINSQTGVISYNIGYSRAGDYTVRVTASDGYLSDSKDLILHIVNVPICGDNTCDSSESCYSCSSDCTCPVIGGGAVTGDSNTTTVNQTVNTSNVTASNVTLSNTTLVNNTVNVLNNSLVNQSNTNSTIKHFNKTFSDLIVNYTINSILSFNSTANFSVIENSEFLSDNCTKPVINVDVLEINDSLVDVFSFRTVLQVSDGSNISLITKNITNINNESIVNFTVIEFIPKSYASSVSELVFHSNGNLVVIEDDPVVAWVFSELKPSESVSVSYEVKKDVSAISEVPVHTLATASKESLVRSGFAELITGFSLLPSSSGFISVALGLVFLLITLFSFREIRNY